MKIMKIFFDQKNNKKNNKKKYLYFVVQINYIDMLY